MLKIHVSLLATQPSTTPSLRYIFLRDFFARNFEHSLVQREWDILTVRIVRWATIIRPTRGTQQRFENTQTKLLPGYPRALFVKPTKGRIVSIDQSKSSRVVFTTYRSTNSEETFLLSAFEKMVFLGAIWW